MGGETRAPYKGLGLIALIYNGWFFVAFNCGLNCIYTTFWGPFELERLQHQGNAVPVML